MSDDLRDPGDDRGDQIGNPGGDDAPPPDATTRGTRWGVPILLMIVTFASIVYAGRTTEDGMWGGLYFAVPLMAILMAHEFGHFIAGRIHGVDISPPYFIPMPFVLFGTMGAVIRMRGAIRSRNALLDVGAAGPLAGMAVAIPVLIYGIATSDVQPLPTDGEMTFLLEGRSLLYLGMIYALKGPIAEGHDIFLTQTAFAGWTGLLVTMINLLPIGQLDGGHIAFALFGPRQNRHSERLRKLLPLLCVAVGAAYGLPAYAAGARGDALVGECLAGMPWLVWAFVLWVMTRMSGKEHPPTGTEALTPTRRVIAIATLVLFVLLFMPAWLRVQ